MPTSFNLMTAAGTIAVVSLSTLPVNAVSFNYDALYIFGDSFSDRGNVLNVSQAQNPPISFPPEPFYSGGRFTYGLNWVDYVAQETGLDPTNFTEVTSNSPFPENGINFSFGGATTGRDNIAPNLPGLEQQIDAYEQLLGGRTADPNALYVVWVSGNDYFGGFADNPLKPISNITKEVETLANLGARNILVANLPSLGNTPLARDRGAEIANALNNLTNAHNALLAQSISQLRQKYPKINLIDFNLAGLFQDILNNPGEFGFANVTDSCTDFDFPIMAPEDIANWNTCRSSLENDPKAFLFYDNMHATTAGHRLMADAVLRTVSVPEPTAVNALSLLGLGLLGRALQKNRFKKNS